MGWLRKTNYSIFSWRYHSLLNAIVFFQNDPNKYHPKLAHASRWGFTKATVLLKSVSTKEKIKKKNRTNLNQSLLNLPSHVHKTPGLGGLTPWQRCFCMLSFLLQTCCRMLEDCTNLNLWSPPVFPCVVNNTFQLWPVLSDWGLLEPELDLEATSFLTLWKNDDAHHCSYH